MDAVLDVLSVLLGAGIQACTPNVETAEKSTVRIVLEVKQDGNVHLSVAHDGSGISEDTKHVKQHIDDILGLLTAFSCAEVVLRTTGSDQKVLRVYSQCCDNGTPGPLLGPQLAAKHGMFSGTDSGVRLQLEPGQRMDTGRLHRSMLALLHCTAACNPLLNIECTAQLHKDKATWASRNADYLSLGSPLSALRSGAAAAAKHVLGDAVGATGSVLLGAGKAASRGCRWEAHAAVALRKLDSARPEIGESCHLLLCRSGVRAPGSSTALQAMLATLDWSAFGLDSGRVLPREPHTGKDPERGAGKRKLQQQPGGGEETAVAGQGSGSLQPCLIVVNVVPLGKSGAGALATTYEGFLARTAVHRALEEVKRRELGALRSRRERCLAEALPCLARAVVDLVRMDPAGRGLPAAACDLLGAVELEDLHGALLAELQRAVGNGKAAVGRGTGLQAAKAKTLLPAALAWPEE